MKIGDIKLQWKSHMSLDDEHITVYASDDNESESVYMLSPHMDVMGDRTDITESTILKNNMHNRIGFFAILNRKDNIIKSNEARNESIEKT